MKRKKVLFFIILDLSHPLYTGLKRKIDGQISAFKSLGYDIDLISYSDKGTVLNNDKIIHHFKSSGTFSRRFNYYKNASLSLTSLPDIKSYDYLLIRYPMTNPWFNKALRRIKKINPGISIILEIPTFPFTQELITVADKINLLLELAYVRHLKKYVDKIITYCGQDEIYGIPATSISNGIDISKIKPVKQDSWQSDTINLIGVANVCKWHGYDRLVNGLKTYMSNNPSRKIVFNIVGKGEESENLEQVVKNAGLEETIIFHGYKTGADLDEVYNQAHIGIGSLAMHRINLKVGSPLKVREYCARGIPFVIGYDDTGFKDDFFGMHKISPDESPVDIQKLVDFCDLFSAQKSKDLIVHAQEHLSWASQLGLVFPGIQNVEANN